MGLATIARVRMETDLFARVQKVALQRGTTFSEEVRRSIIQYLENLPDGNPQVQDLAERRRERVIYKGPSLDLHDGAMFADKVWEIVATQKGVIQKRRLLEPRDYDYFLVLVESETKTAKTYEQKDWILEELRRLVDELKEEKTRLEKKMERQGSLCGVVSEKRAKYARK